MAETTPILMLHDLICATGDPAQDALTLIDFEEVPGFVFCVPLYGGETDSYGDPLVLNEGQLDMSINIPACINFLYEHGAVAGALTPTYAFLDFEGLFEVWMTGDDPERIAYTQAQFIGALQAIKAEFTTGIMLACSSMPLVRNFTTADPVSWKYATEINREVRIAEATERYAPIFAEMDWACPYFFVLSPDFLTMDPEQRPFEVLATGSTVLAGTAPGYNYPDPPTLADWDVEWEVWTSYQEAGLEVVNRCKAINGQPSQPVWPLNSTVFYPFTPIFNVDTQVPTFLPQALFNKALARSRTYSGPPATGWLLWGATGYWQWLATQPDNDPQNPYTPQTIARQLQSRNMITQVQYGGVSPVPSLFPTWQDAGLILETANTFNTATLALLNGSVMAGANMATFSESEVTNAIIQRIQAVMDEFGCNQCVYMVDEYSTPVSVQRTTVQVMIRDGTQQHPLSGAWLTRSMVAVSLNWRELTDRQPRATNRTIGARGIVDVMNAIRYAINQSFLGEGSDALLTTPMLLVTAGAPIQVEGKPGWMKATDVYEYGRAFDSAETGA